MARNNEILYISEYLKDVLYFAIIKPGRTLKNTDDTHYFTIDNQLIYENYYSDFGPLNLGCVYRYCKLLNDKFKLYLNKQIIVHYTSADPKKKANAAFLLGCFGVLYLSLPARDALRPLLANGQSYRPFQDATQGDSVYTITIMDCLQAIKKARELGFFNFQDFNFEEYDRLDKIQGGDLNWIVPGKFLAFIGPVDYSVSLYHPPEMYIDYFKENNVKLVIRLNKRLYDGNVFRNSGIEHCDLFFPDGSCPPRNILFKFLQISEEIKGAIAVHCKAGLGRTGSLIGCYLIKHYHMTASEAIGWMRICRPGSVIGHQQGWLTQLEPWLLKQGNIYRKRLYQDVNRLPTHEFGIYSEVEKSMQAKPVVYSKSPPSSPPPLKRHGRAESKSPPTIRPHASKVREESIDEYEYDQSDEESLFSAFARLYDFLWWSLAVRSAKFIPRICQTSCCYWLNVAALHKRSDHESPNRRLNTSKNPLNKGDLDDKKPSSTRVHRGSGGGEARIARTPKSSASPSKTPGNSMRSTTESNKMSTSGFHPMPPFRSTHVPIIRNMNDARNFLLKNGMYEKDKTEKPSPNSCVMVTSQYSPQSRTSIVGLKSRPNSGTQTPSTNSAIKNYQGTLKTRTTQPARRRLGRSPSPPSVRIIGERSRATNTPQSGGQATAASHSDHRQCQSGKRTFLKEAVSGMLLFVNGPPSYDTTSVGAASLGAASLGAASLGARREAPAPRAAMLAPSVRSDERPLATQGDMLNSIKLQRRLRETMHERSTVFKEKKPTPPLVLGKDRAARRKLSHTQNTAKEWSHNSVAPRVPKPMALDAMLQQASRSVMNRERRAVSPRSVDQRSSRHPSPNVAAARKMGETIDMKPHALRPQRPSKDRRPHL